MKTLIVLLGPTGVGKTEAAITLAETLHIPIINADSRQIFREIPIGTAAPTTEQQQRVPHLFVGHKSVTDYYSAAQYEADVLSLLPQLFTESDYALLAGGAMMYIDAVCKGIDEIPAIPEAVRREMMERYEQEGLPTLLDELRQLDPDYYAVVDKHNPRRVIHALEVCHVAQRPYSSFRKGMPQQRNFHIVTVGLLRDRYEMHERINRRVLTMIAQGLVAEAQAVYPLRHVNALNTVGYKELFRHFDGAITLDDAISQIQAHTRAYLRRQMTWFRRNPAIHWLHPDDILNTLTLLQQ